MPSLELLKIRINSIKTTLDKASKSEKDSNVSMHIAGHFNSIIEEVSKNYPDLIGSLPKKLERDLSYHLLNVANINYLDLDIYCETLINLLEFIERNSAK